MVKKQETQIEEMIVISPPKIHTIVFKIKGTAPLMTHRFSKKMEMMQAQIEGKQSSKKKVHKEKNPEQDMNDASYIHEKGWFGVPASSFRAGLISACRLANFKMTIAKLSLFIIADGHDKVDGVPIIKINGKREMSIMTVRNATGVADVRVRPIWKEWEMSIKVNYDRTQFSETDVYNLFMRVGMQVGIGEGRPDSKQSAGLGYGTFEIVIED
jgi:hypothetical protein